MKKKPVTTWFYPLFEHMAANQSLHLVESEAEDIIAAVHASEKRRAESIAPTVAQAVRKMAGPKPPKGYEVLSLTIAGEKNHTDKCWHPLYKRWFPVNLMTAWNRSRTYARKLRK